MSQAFLALLGCSISMAPLTLALYLLRSVLAKRCSPRLRYLLWLIVLGGYLIPLRPKLGPSLVALVPCPSAAAHLRETGGAFTVISGSYWGRLLPLLTAVWAVGSVFCLARLLVRCRRMGRLLRRWSIDIREPSLLRDYEAVCRSMGLRRAPPLRVCPPIPTPMLAGMFHPLVLLSPSMAVPGGLTPKARRLVMRHELVHFKRRDQLIKLAGAIVCALHWFNPLIYLVCAQVRRECELSCDETVALCVGRRQRVIYGETILRAASEAGAWPFADQTSSYFCKSAYRLQERLITVMNARAKRAGVFWVSLVLAATVASGFIFSCEWDRPYHCAAWLNRAGAQAQMQACQGLDVAEGAPKALSPLDRAAGKAPSGLWQQQEALAPLDLTGGGLLLDGHLVRLASDLGRRRVHTWSCGKRDVDSITAWGSGVPSRPRGMPLT